MHRHFSKQGIFEARNDELTELGVLHLPRQTKTKSNLNGNHIVWQQLHFDLLSKYLNLTCGKVKSKWGMGTAPCPFNKDLYAQEK